MQRRNLVKAAAAAVGVAVCGLFASVAEAARRLVLNGKVELFSAGPPTDGALTVRTLVPRSRTAVDLGVHVDGPAPAHAITEMVWYGTVRQDSGPGSDMERFNISQIAGDRQVRFGVERGPLGSYRQFRFAFENPVEGAPARIPFIIDTPDTDKSTQVILEIRLPETGAHTFRAVEVGEPDSAGPGRRLLYVVN